MDMIHSPDTLQAGPIPEPHHPITSTAELFQPVNEGVLNKVLDQSTRLWQQIPNSGFNVESRLQPDNDVGDACGHAIRPVIVHDLVIARIGEGNRILNIEAWPIVWI
ncbi:hypothetical protein XPA_006826 [Xanthoria parietina]